MTQVEVVAAFNEGYAQHAAVMMVSLLKHTSRKVGFSFLVSDIKAGTRHKLTGLASAYGSTVTFHDVDESMFDNVVLGSDLSIHSYFRLLIPTLLRDKIRILYLDVDIVVTGDVGPLFDVDLEGKAIGAVADPGVSPTFIANVSRDRVKYFNAGVAVMAVEKLSAEDSASWLRHAREEHARITYHDQCVLNYFMEFRKIHPRFNLMSQFLQPYDSLGNREYSPQEVAEAVANPTVVHYNASFGKPWGRYCTHPLKRKYQYYLLFTPWRWKLIGILLWQLRSGLSHRLRHAA